MESILSKSQVKGILETYPIFNKVAEDIVSEEYETYAINKNLEDVVKLKPKTVLYDKGNTPKFRIKESEVKKLLDTKEFEYYNNELEYRVNKYKSEDYLTEYFNLRVGIDLQGNKVSNLKQLENDKESVGHTILGIYKNIEQKIYDKLYKEVEDILSKTSKVNEIEPISKEDKVYYEFLEYYLNKKGSSILTNLRMLYLRDELYAKTNQILSITEEEEEREVGVGIGIGYISDSKFSLKLEIDFRDNKLTITKYVYKRIEYKETTPLTKVEDISLSKLGIENVLTDLFTNMLKDKN